MRVPAHLDFILIEGKTAKSGPPETEAVAGLANEEIIELQDLRMSPIPSIRNRHNSRFSTASAGEEPNKFPPSFRMSRGSLYRPNAGKYLPV